MINPDRWRQVQDIYVDAMQMEPLKRTPFLEKVCGADVYMRREVESLLECENKVGKFLEQTAIEVLVRMYGPEVSEEQPDTAGDLIGCVIDDRYIVREYIGSGGMGDVYRADHRLLGMPVAIKRLSRDLRDRKEFRQRFIEEARRTVLLDHENVSRVKDVVEESDEVFVVMEFIDGQTLRTRLGQPFELDEFLDIAVQCASALAAAHRERIVHLDIKPDNIMLTASQKVKVCDFGVAHQLPLAESPIVEAPRWIFAGTPAYMAPEVIESNHFDARADIFSIGVVFYEMLAGEHPFRSDNVRATTKRIVNEPAPSLRLLNRKLPARLIHLIDRMLAKDPDQRMDSDELVRDLQSIA